MRFNRIANNFRSSIRSGMTHSSGVSDAAATNKDANAVRAESFEKRRQIERQRQHVGSYKDSMVVNTYQSELKHFDIKRKSHYAGPATLQDDNIIGMNNRQLHGNSSNSSGGKIDIVRPSGARGRQSQNAAPGGPKGAAIVRRSGPSMNGFREPSSRGYNPYS